MLTGLIQAEAIFSAHGYDVVVTEWWRPPRPGKPSLHPVHHAFDLRARNIPDGQRTMMKKDLNAALGPDWDVVLHGVGSGVHFHCELQRSSLPQPR